MVHDGDHTVTDKTGPYSPVLLDVEIGITDLASNYGVLSLSRSQTAIAVIGVSVRSPRCVHTDPPGTIRQVTHSVGVDIAAQDSQLLPLVPGCCKSRFSSKIEA